MIGIAIINYNTFQKTRECIDSIKKNTVIPYRIYLLENGSKNESVEYLKKWYGNDPDVKLIISENNEGYARGNNICIDAMVKDGCQYGIVSNNDILCKKNAIDELIQSIIVDSRILLAGSKIISPVGEFQKSVRLIERKGIHYLLHSSYLFRSFCRKQSVKELLQIEAINEMQQVKWVSGAFFAFSINNMMKIGKFDSRTFLFFEEAILACKARKYNLALMYNPRSEVIHDHAFSTGGGLNITSRIAADQSERYYFKNYTEESKMFCVALRLIRSIEVLYSFGKRLDFKSINQYFTEIKKEI